MFTKVDRTNKGVSGLPDTPNLSTAEMQEKFDELGILVADGLNGLIDELEVDGANNIGLLAPPGYEGERNILQDVLDEDGRKIRANSLARHTHNNKELLDLITESLISTISNIATTLVNIRSVNQSVTDAIDEIPTSHAIVNYVSALGGGDMMKATYDPNGDGVVAKADSAGTADYADSSNISEHSGDAQKLVSERKILVDLSSEEAADFDGSEDVSPGVSGVLPVTKGGTGGNTAATARTNLGLGMAATKNYTTTISSRNTSLPTSEAVYNELKTRGEGVPNYASRQAYAAGAVTVPDNGFVMLQKATDANATVTFWVDGVLIETFYCTAYSRQQLMMPVAKGQVIAYRKGTAATSTALAIYFIPQKYRS